MSETKISREELSKATVTYNSLSPTDKKIIDTMLDMAAVLLMGVQQRKAKNGTDN